MGNIVAQCSTSAQYVPEGAEQIGLFYLCQLCGEKAPAYADPLSGRLVYSAHDRERGEDAPMQTPQPGSYAALSKQCQVQAAALVVLREAVDFYANEVNWTSRAVTNVFGHQEIIPRPMDGDYGLKARAALAAEGERGEKQ